MANVKYNPKTDVFNHTGCGGAMRWEKLGRKLWVLRCTKCQHAEQAELVNIEEARMSRLAYLGTVWTDGCDRAVKAYQASRARRNGELLRYRVMVTLSVFIISFASYAALTVRF